jgi:hypothetical protein
MGNKIDDVAEDADNDEEMLMITDNVPFPPEID